MHLSPGAAAPLTTSCLAPLHCAPQLFPSPMPPHRTETENDDPRRRRQPRRKQTGSQSRTESRPLQDTNGDAAGESSELRELRDALAASQAEVAQLRATRPPPRNARRLGPRIGRPKKVSAVKVGRIQEVLGMDDASWNALRFAIRFALTAARLDPALDWKSQDKGRLERARNVVKEDYPEMGRFVGDWAFDRLAQETFSGSKSYRKCVNNTNTYRGRKAAECRAAPPSRRRRQSPSPERQPTPGPSRSTVNASPAPSPLPSTQRPRRPAPHRIDSYDDPDDDLMNFGDDEEQEEEADPTGKKRASAEDDEEEIVPWE